MEPRLAMTAAMAFFSIALTLNLLGVRLDQIKTADFSPTSLKQTYFQANATAVRYYDNLKVVRVLESRVDDIRQANAVDQLPEQSQPQPEAQPEAQPEPKPEQKPEPKPDTPHGSSRRESPLPVAPTVLNARFDFSTEPHRRPAFAAAPISRNLKQEGGLA
jgi:outer membrane biosynthesis protein TonB